MFFKSGSDINLTCIAQQAPAPPSYIYWYKDGDLINYSQRGGINVLTERQTKTSKLVIARVVPSDSGNYTCIPSNSSKYFDYSFLLTFNLHASVCRVDGSPHGFFCDRFSLLRTGEYTRGNCPGSF